MSNVEPIRKDLRKQCSMCKDYKLFAEFFKEKKKALGLQSRCKLCATTEVIRWKKERKENEITTTDIAKIDAATS